MLAEEATSCFFVVGLLFWDLRIQPILVCARDIGRFSSYYLHEYWIIIKVHFLIYIWEWMQLKDHVIIWNTRLFHIAKADHQISKTLND